MSKLRDLLYVSTACLLACTASLSGAATKGYMKIDGAQGDSNDKNYEGWFELLSYSYDRSYWDQKLDAPSAVDHGEGRRRGGEMQITRSMGTAIDSLYRSASSGEVIPEVTIEIYSNNSHKHRRQRLITYTLENVWVKMLRIDRKSKSKKTDPIETMSIGFSHMRWYSEVPDGTPNFPTDIKRWH